MTEEVIEGAIVAVESGNLLAASSGRELIERATERAEALAEVIDKQKLFVTLSGRRHVRVEGWTLLGSLMGVFPVTTEVAELQRDGTSFGFEARVEARTLAGAVVGAAVARCTRDEANWNQRKGQRVDDFALLSMAQTRATSKALRMPLGYVMQLAGFETTPAEEMTQETAQQKDEADELRRKIVEAVADGKLKPEAAQKAAEDHGVGTSGRMAKASADVLRSMMQTLGLVEAPQETPPKPPEGAPEPGIESSAVGGQQKGGNGGEAQEPDVVNPQPPTAATTLGWRVKQTVGEPWKPTEADLALSAEARSERMVLLRSIAELCDEMGLDDEGAKAVLGGNRRNVAKALGTARLVDLRIAKELLLAEHQRRVEESWRRPSTKEGE